MPASPTIDEIKEVIGHSLKHEDCSAFLFGSRATRNHKTNSDWDIGVWGAKPLDVRVLDQLIENLEDLRTLQAFDVVDFANIDDGFRKIATRNVIHLFGKPIHDQN